MKDREHKLILQTVLNKLRIKTNRRLVIASFILVGIILLTLVIQGLMMHKHSRLIDALIIKTITVPSNPLRTSNL